MRKVWAVQMERGGSLAYFTHKNAAEQYARLYSDASVVRIGLVGCRQGVFGKLNIPIPYIPPA